MKELSIEEKAKRYDEAIEKAKSKIKNDKDHVLYEDDILSIFSELKESDDERIREELIMFINCKKSLGSVSPEELRKSNSWIAWLEKQGERKQGKSALKAVKKEKVDNRNCVNHADKVEPKFEVGDWVVNTITGNVEQIIEVTNNEYICSGTLIISFDNQHLLKNWTIQDAKDSDVLVTSDGSIFIFAGVVDCACKYYVALTICNDIKINKEVKGGYWETSRAVHPATKEQRDTLMKTITDAGYTFDFEKKEMNKIEPKTTGWSEEDEKMFEHIIAKATLHFSSINYLDEEEINFLKSLKDRYTWKPSLSQLNALSVIAKGYAPNIEEIKSLYNDLKKLREE